MGAATRLGAAHHRAVDLLHAQGHQREVLERMEPAFFDLPVAALGGPRNGHTRSIPTQTLYNVLQRSAAVFSAQYTHAGARLLLELVPEFD